LAPSSGVVVLSSGVVLDSSGVVVPSSGVVVDPGVVVDSPGGVVIDSIPGVVGVTGVVSTGASSAAQPTSQPHRQATLNSDKTFFIVCFLSWPTLVLPE
jgi:hypothetical protein